eukprot:SAG11_NODE_2116_length_3792_cov_5.166802_3_plen_93_part_00
MTISAPRIGQCLLLSKDWTGRLLVSENQTRAQFSIWAVMAAPLLISGTVTNMSSYTLQTYSNRDVIAVSQDKLGMPVCLLVVWHFWVKTFFL